MPDASERLADLSAVLALLEGERTAAARRVAAGVRRWLSNRDGETLEQALALPGRAREIWRQAQRRALLCLLAEVLAPGADRWSQAAAIQSRACARTRRRQPDLADQLLDRLAALGPIPSQDRVYRLLVSNTQNLPAPPRETPSG